MNNINSAEIGNNIEQLSGKELLQTLEDSGKYVFHGSYQKLDEFEPRQSMTLDQNGKEIPDGPPAVFASDRADLAIFRALINHHMDKAPGNWSGWDINGNNRIFKAVKTSIEKAKDPSHRGFVHVFNKSDFKTFRGDEEICEKNVRPVSVIEVKGEDLPENIEIVEPLTV